MGRRAKGWQCYNPYGDTDNHHGGGNSNHFKTHVNPFLLNLKNKKDALDVGCGNGRHCKILSEVFDRVVGIDIDYPFDERFRERNVQFYNKDFSEMEDVKFDLILFWGSFYNMENYEETMVKCHDLLNDDGFIIVGDDPSRRKDKEGTGHHDEFNYNLGVLMKENNFEEVDEVLGHYRITVMRKR